MFALSSIARKELRRTICLEESLGIFGKVLEDSCCIRSCDVALHANVLKTKTMVNSTYTDCLYTFTCFTVRTQNAMTFVIRAGFSLQIPTSVTLWYISKRIRILLMTMIMWNPCYPGNRHISIHQESVISFSRFTSQTHMMFRSGFSLNRRSCDTLS